MIVPLQPPAGLVTGLCEGDGDAVGVELVDGDGLGPS